MVEFENDLFNWINRLRWKDFYSWKPNTDDKTDKDVQMLEMNLIKNKDVKNAPNSKSAALELFIQLVVHDAHEHKSNRKHNNPDNLQTEARNALKELKNLYQEKDIVIRPFDKGVGFFLIYKQDYVNKALELLSDINTYEVVEQEETANAIIAEITEWTNRYKKEKGMTDKIIKWFIHYNLIYIFSEPR